MTLSLLLLLQAFSHHGFQETESVDDSGSSTYYKEDVRTALPKGPAQRASTAGIELTYRNDVLLQTRHASVAPAHESVELTRSLQEFSRKFPTLADGCLEGRMAFALDGLVKAGVSVSLNIVVKNDLTLVSSNVVVARQSSQGQVPSTMTVASFPIRHAPCQLDCLADDPDAPLFDEYFKTLQRQIDRTSDGFQHVILMAELSAEEFPFVIREVNYKDDENGKSSGEEADDPVSLSFAIDCAVSKASPMNWMESSVSWNASEDDFVNVVSHGYMDVDRELADRRVSSGVRLATSLVSTNATDSASEAREFELVVTATLNDNLRLPGFCFGTKDYRDEIRNDKINRVYNLADELSAQITLIDIEQLGNGCRASDEANALWKNKEGDGGWVCCSAVEYGIRSRHSEGILGSAERLQGGTGLQRHFLSSAKFSSLLTGRYRQLFKIVKSTMPFLRAAIAMQRVEILRRDVHIRCCLPDCLSLSWTPWAFTSHDNISRPRICMPAVAVEWSAAPSVGATECDQDVAEFQCGWCVVRVRSRLMKPALDENR